MTKVFAGFGLVALALAWLGLAPPAYGQAPSCTPGPGDIANVYVQVRSVTSDGFSGDAFGTLDTSRPTGQTMTVHVGATTTWHGHVKSLAAVKVGGEKLQVAGKVRPDCSLDAANIFSSETSPALPGTGTGAAGRAPAGAAAALLTAVLLTGAGAMSITVGLGRRRS